MFVCLGGGDKLESNGTHSLLQPATPLPPPEALPAPHQVRFPSFPLVDLIPGSLPRSLSWERCPLWRPSKPLIPGADYTRETSALLLLTHHPSPSLSRAGIT